MAAAITLYHKTQMSISPRCFYTTRYIYQTLNIECLINDICNKYLISYIQQQSLHLIHSTLNTQYVTLCNNNFEVLVESEFWNHIDDVLGDFEVLSDAI